jgi:RNA polymerase sigma-70 factor (ECF subfamily)
MADQDRSRWDAAELAEGRRVLDRAVAMGRGGVYALQAAIASLQMDEFPDWGEIEALYRRLACVTASPVVELNRAVAVAELEGPAAALRLVDGLDLDGYQWFHSTRADLLRRLGRREEALAAYRRALELTKADAERRFLERRMEGCS